MEDKATQTRHWKMNESDAYDNEARLLEELRKLPDFDKYPLPASWYKKFDLKPVEAVDMKTYLAGGGIMKAITGGPCTSYEFKEPQRNEDGSLKEVKVFLEEQDLGVKIIQKPADLSKPAFAEIPTESTSFDMGSWIDITATNSTLWSKKQLDYTGQFVPGQFSIINIVPGSFATGDYFDVKNIATNGQIVKVWSGGLLLEIVPNTNYRFTYSKSAWTYAETTEST